MKIIRIIMVFAFLASNSATAWAQSCYSPVEAEAEQGIRIHSELMVIGLNCQHMGSREGLNLYGQYREITSRHADLFGTYENILLDFFEKRGDSKPEASLNTLRTNFANKISKDAAGMRPDVFCARYYSRVADAFSMDQTQIRQWAATFYPSHPVSYPICKNENKEQGS